MIFMAAMCKRRFGISLVFLLLTGFVHAAPIVFESTDTPPFWSPSLPENGFGGALLRLVSEAAGVTYAIEYFPVKRFRESLATYMVGDPGILINQKHRAILPIGLFRSAFFYYKPHHDVIEFHGLKDLRGHTLGVLRGTIEDKALFVKNGVNVEESDSVDSLLRKLKRGRIDLCILVSDSGRDAIRNLFPKEKSDFVQIIIPDSVRPIAILIDVDVPEGKIIAERYSKVLNSTLHSRKYHEILERFFGENNIPDDWFEQMAKFEQLYSIGSNN